MQGFETRSTTIANRIIALRNLKNEINQLQTLENYPGEKLSGREWRRRRRENVAELEEDGYGDDAFEFNSRGLCAKNPSNYSDVT